MGPGRAVWDPAMTLYVGPGMTLYVGPAMTLPEQCMAGTDVTAPLHAGECTFDGNLVQ